MEQYEYQVDKFSARDVRPATDKLTEYGKKGWKLVQAVVAGAVSNGEVVIILERPFVQKTKITKRDNKVEVAVAPNEVEGEEPMEEIPGVDEDIKALYERALEG